MWRNCRELNRIDESISGWNTEETVLKPYNIRYNKDSVEYSTDEESSVEYTSEIFNTSAGEIRLYDKGEFGGHLEIGGKIVSNGNFSYIFEINKHKYTIDSLKHMSCGTFRLIEIFDDGTIKELYNSDKLADLHNEFYSLDNVEYKNISKEIRDKYKIYIDYQIGLDSYFIKDNIIIFLCSGCIYNLDKNGKDRYSRIKYLLEYNTNTGKFREIKLNNEELEYSYVTSIILVSDELFIGCDKEVIKLNINTMDIEHLTDIEDEIIEKILEHKRSILHKYS